MSLARNDLCLHGELDDSCGYRPWNVYSRMNWCDLRCHCVSTCLFGYVTRGDIVSVWQWWQTVQCLWLTDWIFFLFSSFHQSRQKNSTSFTKFGNFSKKSDHLVKSPTFLSKTKGDTLFPTTGNHGSIFSCPLRHSVVCCMFLSHTMWVRDKIHYVGYASIQCVNICVELREK